MALAACLGAGACTAPARGFCEAAAACDDDDTPWDRVGPSDDSVDVCAAEADGTLAVLRTNDEPECHALADAYEAWFSCAQIAHANGDACDGLRAREDNACDDEVAEVEERLDEVGRTCTGDEE